MNFSKKHKPEIFYCIFDGSTTFVPVNLICEFEKNAKLLITPYILELEPSWHHICHRKTITLNFPHKKFVFLSKDPKTRKPLVYFRSPNLHSFRFKKNEKLRVTPNIIELEPFWHHFWTFRFFELFDQKVRFPGEKKIPKESHRSFVNLI